MTSERVRDELGLGRHIKALYNIKDFLYPLIMIAAIESPLLQLLPPLFLYISLFAILVKKRPFLSNLDNFLFIFNEICYSVVLLLLVLAVIVKDQWNESKKSRWIGLPAIGAIGLILGVNIGIGAWQSLVVFARFVENGCNRLQKNKQVSDLKTLKKEKTPVQRDSVKIEVQDLDESVVMSKKEFNSSSGGSENSQNTQKETMLKKSNFGRKNAEKIKNHRRRRMESSELEQSELRAINLDSSKLPDSEEGESKKSSPDLNLAVQRQNQLSGKPSRSNSTPYYPC